MLVESPPLLICGERRGRRGRVRCELGPFHADDHHFGRGPAGRWYSWPVHPEPRPRRAFLVIRKDRPGSGGITAATTAGNARYRGYVSAREMDYRVGFDDFRVLRLPDLDEWAASDHYYAREWGCYVPDTIPGGADAVRRRLGTAA